MSKQKKDYKIDYDFFKENIGNYDKFVVVYKIPKSDFFELRWFCVIDVTVSELNDLLTQLQEFANNNGYESIYDIDVDQSKKLPIELTFEMFKQIPEMYISTIFFNS